MALDIQVKKAIEDAVREEDQPDSLARKLIAWMNDVVAGNEDVNDPQSAERHLELLYTDTQTESIVAD